MQIENFKNPFMRDYLTYTEYTETPAIFHAWAALSGISAALGKRAWFPFGPYKIYPNMYVALVGTPGARKDGAMSEVEKFVRRATATRFGPQDTGGAPQGLIRAMEGDDGDAREAANEEELVKTLNNATLMNMDVEPDYDNMSVEELAQVSMEDLGFGDTRDRNAVYVISPDMNSFTGYKSHTMLQFITAVWDGKPYTYQTKAGTQSIKDPCLNILTGTTPSNIAMALPVESIGQGLLSRFVMVYASEKKRSLYLPQAGSLEAQAKLDHVFRIASTLDGPFQLQDDTHAALKKLYERPVDIEDHRFTYYMERRYTHLIKTSMAMAASCGRMTVTGDDVYEADKLLCYTEIHMADALGEFGMSPEGVVKQRLLDFLQKHKEAVPINILWQMLSRDVKHMDFLRLCKDLEQQEKVKRVKTDLGEALLFSDTKKQQKAVAALLKVVQ